MKNTFKKAIALLVALSISASANVPSLATAATAFTDVKPTAWYYNYVNKLVDLKITSGIGNNKFAPNNTVTRAEFVTFLCKVKGYEQTQGNPFVDSQKSWAKGYITIALANGIMDLPTDKKFRPTDAITRLEAVEMMCRALGIDKSIGIQSPYLDVKATDTGYTNAAFTNYLMQGSLENGKRYFKPSDKLTRGEVASVIVNTYDFNTDRLGYLNKKSADDNKKDIEDKTVSQADIDFARSKGIIPSDTANSYVFTDAITANDYIKMLVLTMGKTNVQDFIKTAIDLGVVKDGDFANYSNEISRADMAKLALRAYEKLNTISYPDYLEAYKTMVTDYKYLGSAEIRQNSLKCVSEGLMPMVNGAFRQSDKATYGLATTVVHRILSATERNKSKPVFATPDKEFEQFMSEANYSKACQYCFRGRISKVVDGKIIWNMEDGSQLLLPISTNPDANKEAYNAFKSLLASARKYNHFVEGCYSLGFGDDTLQLFYCTSQKAGSLGKARENYNFFLAMQFNNFTKTLGGTNVENIQKQRTDYLWIVGCFFDKNDISSETFTDYQQERLMLPFKSLLATIYDSKCTSYMFDLILKEDSNLRKSIDNKTTYSNKTCLHPSIFYGRELQIKVCTSKNGISEYFGTNK